MIALDSNILIRFVVNDDNLQAQKVLKRFESAERSGEIFFISLLVVQELIWVLSKVYRFSSAKILEALEALYTMQIMEFESPGLLQKLLLIGKNTSVDLSDLLIGVSALEHGCKHTLTFDKKASKSDLFKFLT